MLMQPLEAAHHPNGAVVSVASQPSGPTRDDWMKAYQIPGAIRIGATPLQGFAAAQAETQFFADQVAINPVLTMTQQLTHPQTVMAICDDLDRVQLLTTPVPVFVPVASQPSGPTWEGWIEAYQLPGGQTTVRIGATPLQGLDTNFLTDQVAINPILTMTQQHTHPQSVLATEWWYPDLEEICDDLDRVQLSTIPVPVLPSGSQPSGPTWDDWREAYQIPRGQSANSPQGFAAAQAESHFLADQVAINPVITRTSHPQSVIATQWWYPDFVDDLDRVQLLTTPVPSGTLVPVASQPSGPEWDDWRKAHQIPGDQTCIGANLPQLFASVQADTPVLTRIPQQVTNGLTVMTLEQLMLRENNLSRENQALWQHVANLTTENQRLRQVVTLMYQRQSR